LADNIGFQKGAKGPRPSAGMGDMRIKEKRGGTSGGIGKNRKSTRYGKECKVLCALDGEWPRFKKSVIDRSGKKSSAP